MTGVHHTSATAAPGDLSRFRHEFYQCLTTRADALFELTDAALCADGPVTSLVELSLATEHRRGHGTLHDSLARPSLHAITLIRMRVAPSTRAYIVKHAAEDKTSRDAQRCIKRALARTIFKLLERTTPQDRVGESQTNLAAD